MSINALPSPSLYVRLAHEVTVRSDGQLAGGAPFRLLRLTDSGAAHIRRWARADGDVIGPDMGARALARRLLDYGVLISDGCEPGHAAAIDLSADVDFIVPAHDRSAHLDQCLVALAACRASVMVVDDGSEDSAAIAEIAARNGAKLTRLDRNRGPAAARNAGLRATYRPFVAFVDSDVIVPPGSMERLLSHFADPAVAIAAPRVLPAYPNQRGWVAGYENAHSALDMGPTPGNAGPGNRVPYVISAALLTRRAAIGSGFVEALKSGEDVDLGWRVAAAGWRVLYDPQAVVRHHHRVRLMPLLRKRWTYGRSIGPLARRHPGSLAPLRANRLTLAAVAAAVAGRPVPAAALLATRATRLRRHVGGDPILTARITGIDVWYTSLGVARALRRSWLPALLVSVPYSRHARRILVLAVLLRLFEDDHLHPRYLPLALLDDFIAALALWSSCAQMRIIDPLVPRQPRMHRANEPSPAPA